MFVLAHLSDPHLGPLPRPNLRELASKRFLGYVNWLRSRRAIHRSEALDAVTRDLARERPDHIAVTGDLVNIALPSEFEGARQWLESLGPPSEVSLVPGNHDAYVHSAAIHRDRHWAAYMGGENAAFPYVRKRDGVALLGLSTAVVTGPVLATGRLGAQQIARAADLLDELAAAGLFRVVMIHHPPQSQIVSPHKRLTDAAAFRRVLAATGAELVIHGHDHIRALTWLAGKNGARVPSICVPSASASAGRRHEPAGYNLYQIDGKPGAFTCDVISRGLLATGKVAEVNRFPLSWSK